MTSGNKLQIIFVSSGCYVNTWLLAPPLYKTRLKQEGSTKSLRRARETREQSN